MFIKNTMNNSEIKSKVEPLKLKSKSKEQKTGNSVVNHSINGSEIATMLNISEEALELLRNSENQLYDNAEVKGNINEQTKEEINKETQNKMQEYYSKLREMLEQAHESSESAGEGYKTLGRCIKIAMRIVSGDNVPTKDTQYLMENNSELYSMAMNMRMTKEDPEDYESVLDEEKDNDGLTKLIKEGERGTVIAAQTAEITITLS